MGLDAKIQPLVKYCDLERRLALVPSSAKVRGLYFKNALHVLEAAGVASAYLELYPERYTSVRWYPLPGFLERLAVAGALLESPEAIHDGMRRIGMGNARAFADSILGRTLQKILSREPERLLQQASAGRRHSCTYGRWELIFQGRNQATMEMYEEYLWIESYIRGAAEGTMAITGREHSVRSVLDSSFRGRAILQWSDVRGSSRSQR